MKLEPLLLGLLFIVSWTLADSYHSRVFQHLIDVAKETNKVHLRAEIAHDGCRVQVEEFLDLNTWNQLIQFSWHEEGYDSSESTAALASHKVSYLVHNERSFAKVFRYEPYKCTTTTVHPWASEEHQPDCWVESFNFKTNSTNLRSKISRIIDLTVLNVPGSPFAVQLDTDLSDVTLVLGISALWMKAREQNNIGLIEHDETRTSSPFKLKLPDSSLEVSYFFDFQYNYETRALMSCRLEGKKISPDFIINIVDTSYNFSQTAGRDLFLKPIGYNCRDSSMLDAVYEKFRDLDKLKSHKVDLEMIATHFSGDVGTIKSTVSIVSLTYASSPHPTDGQARLAMFLVNEQQTKTIIDYKNKLVYTLEFAANQQLCRVQTERQLGYRVHQSKTTVNFLNGLVLRLDEISLQELIWPQLNSLRMRLLNVVLVSDNVQQFIFEDELPKSLAQLVQEMKEQKMSISIVRVYSRPVLVDHVTQEVLKSGQLELSYIKLIIFDENNTKKVGQIRLNVIDVSKPLSLAKRASMFDLSSCKNLELESMDVTVSYVTEPEVVDLVRRSSFKIINAFYMASILWSSKDPNNGKPDEDNKMSGRDLIKRKLGQSSNFFRIPKVNVEIVDVDVVQLRFTLLERHSPLYAFSSFSESSFVTDSVNHKLFASDKDECADLCLQFSCTIFAYNSAMKQCKIPTQKLNSEAQQSYNGSINYKFVKDKNWELYVNSNSAQLTREATLAEFDQYFRQYSDDQNLESSLMQDAQKLVGSIGAPLFFLEFSEDHRYAISGRPKRFSLSPKKISVDRRPPKLNRPHALKLLSAFQVTLTGERYWPEEVSRISHGSDSKLWSESISEQTHKCVQESAYYTFKRITQVDWTTCADLCYNLNEYDDDTAGQRVCTAISFCSSSLECTLLIKTDFKFSKVLSESFKAEEISSVSSLDRFLRKDLDCFVSKRNFVLDFEGPISLPESYNHQDDEVSTLASGFRWKAAESTHELDPDEAISQCARSCTVYQANGERCLAFDHCNLRTSDKNLERSCELFLFNNLLQTKEDKRVDLSIIRQKLSQQKRNRLGKDVQLNSTKICDRYLVSHIREFSAIQRSQLDIKILQALDRTPNYEETPSLDGCAAACSVKDTGCKAFEFCSMLDQSTKTSSQVCKLFRVKNPPVTVNSADALNPWILEQGCNLYVQEGFRKEHRVRNKDTIEDDSLSFSHPIVIIIVVAAILVTLFIGRHHILDLVDRLNSKLFR